MSIYVLKNNQQLGPFEESAVSDSLRSGAFSPNDLACRQGMTAWQPLTMILPHQSTSSPRPAASHSTPYDLKSWLKAGGILSNLLLIAAIVFLAGSICAYVIGNYLVSLCRNVSVGQPGPTCILLIENPWIVNLSLFGFVLGVAFLIGGLVGKIGGLRK